MSEVKQPQDHKKSLSEPYTFEHDGKTYTCEKSIAAVLTPRWLRENRRRDQLDLTYTLLEEIAGEETLKVIDDMDWDEFKKLSEEVGKATAELMA